MAKRNRRVEAEARELTRKEVRLRTRDRERNRRLYLGTGIAVGLALLFVIIGLVSEFVIKPNSTLASVGEETIVTKDFWKRAKLEKGQLQSQLVQMSQLEEQFGGQGFFAQQINQLQSTLSSPFALGMQVLNKMIDEKVIAQQAAALGITVTDEEVDESLREEVAARRSAITVPQATETAEAGTVATATAAAEATTVASTPLTATTAISDTGLITDAAGVTDTTDITDTASVTATTPLSDSEELTATETITAPATVTTTPAVSETAAVTTGAEITAATDVTDSVVITPAAVTTATVGVTETTGVTITPTDVPTPEPLPTSAVLTDTGYTEGLTALQEDLDLAAGMSLAEYREVVRARLLSEKVSEVIGEQEVATTEEQVHARHILLNVIEPAAEPAATPEPPAEGAPAPTPTPAPRNEAETIALATELRARILAGEKFEDIAAQYSEDTSNAQNGGDLGWFGRGAMVATFEEAAFALPIGQISEPITTSFGVHLIEVLEKDPARTLDEQTLTQKRQEAYQTWLQEQINAAKIERPEDLTSRLPRDL